MSGYAKLINSSPFLFWEHPTNTMQTTDPETGKTDSEQKGCIERLLTALSLSDEHRLRKYIAYLLCFLKNENFC